MEATLLIAPAFLAALLLPHFGLAGSAWCVMSVAVAHHRLFRRRAAWAPAHAAIALFVILFLLGLHGLMVHQRYDALKDCWYFSRPAIEIAFGCIAGWRLGLRRSVVVLIVAGSIVTVDYLMRVASEFSVYLASDTFSARSRYGAGSILSVLTAVLALNPSLQRDLAGTSPARRLSLQLVGVLALLAVLLSRSRSLLVVLVLFVGIAFVLNLERMRRLVLGAAIAGIVLLALGGDRLATTLDLGRILHSIDEVGVAHYTSAEDINSRWRGYESYLALRQFGAFGPVRSLFGGGFGQRVALESDMTLGGQAFDAIPVLHNGFLFVLVKTGLLGLIVFAAALALLFVILRRRTAGGTRLQKVLACWLPAVVAATTGVIAGPFSKSELTPVMILCGVLAVGVPRPTTTIPAPWLLSPARPLRELTWRRSRHLPG